jgi:hypothetical protein
VNARSQHIALVHVCISDNPQVPDFNPTSLARLKKLTGLELHHEPTETQLFTFTQFLGPSFFEHLNTPNDNNGRVLFEYSCGFRPFSTMCEIAWDKIPALALSIEFEGVSKADTRSLVKLFKTSGWNRTGIGIRATSTDSLFLRTTNGRPSRLRVVQETRRTAGRAFVTMRDHLTQLTTSRKAERTPINPRGKEINQFQIRESEAIVAHVAATANTHFQVNVPEHNNQYALAAECFEKFGVRPISFSFPENLSISPISPLQPISPVIPGHAYSYESPVDYFRQYSESALATTHRKAGWDCFRHVEILAAGSVPLMLDSEQIPKYSMIHYPKSALVQVNELTRALCGTPDQATRTAFHNYFKHNLTTKAMANYLLKSAGLQGVENVLFVDQALPQMADYQSVLTLIGLKELLGKACHVAFPVDYIYNDWNESPLQLYGRGFGYSRSVEANKRSQGEVSQSVDQRPASFERSSLNKFDAVIVGSIARNSDLALELLDHFPAKKTIWIHGEDTPPNRTNLALIKESGTHSFIRSINI